MMPLRPGLAKNTKQTAEFGGYRAGLRWGKSITQNPTTPNKTPSFIFANLLIQYRARFVVRCSYNVQINQYITFVISRKQLITL